MRQIREFTLATKPTKKTHSVAIVTRISFNAKTTRKHISVSLSHNRNAKTVQNDRIIETKSFGKRYTYKYV